MTPSDFAPFADETWPDQGIMTKIPVRTLAENLSSLVLIVQWDDRLQALSKMGADIGLAWTKPDCESNHYDNRRCLKYHFSGPIAYIVILPFGRANDENAYQTDQALDGRRTRRPCGFSRNGLGAEIRRVLGSGRVQLVRPADIASCFDLLMARKTDMAAVNEFHGVQQFFAEVLTVSAVPPQTLHAVFAKSHWRATAHLFWFNVGLA